MLRTDAIYGYPARDDDCDVQQRICAEFREMPGLSLTLPQAARLFSVDRPRCERLLGALVRGGVLSTDGRAFARADAGRHSV